MQKKLMGVLMLTMIVINLWIRPAVAVTGQINGGVQINQAICVNSTASHTSTVAVTGTTFDCGAEFPAASGDQITIVLVATGGTGGPVPLCTTAPLTEQEPNDDFPQSQNLSTLQSGGCITVTGSTGTGFGNPDVPDPNADFDYYLFSLAGVSRVRINFSLAAAQTLSYGVFDADTQARLEVQSEPGVLHIAVPAQTSRIILRISTDVPSDYTLTFSDQSGTETPPIGPIIEPLTSSPRMIEDR
jgi:hypothetical protein